MKMRPATASPAAERYTFLSSSSTGNGVKLFAGFAKALRAQHPIALATRLDDARPGAKLLVSFDSTEGDLGSPGLDHAVTQEARALLQSGGNAIRSFGAEGEPVGAEARVFIETFAPKPNMYVFGAIDFARAVATIGRYLGYRV